MLFLAGFLRPSTVNQKRANPNPTGIVEDTRSLPAGLAVGYLEKIADGLIKNSIATSTRTYSSIQTGYLNFCSNIGMPAYSVYCRLVSEIVLLFC